MIAVFVILLLSSVARAIEVAVLRQCIDTFANVTSLDSVCQDLESTSLLEKVVRDHFDTCLQTYEGISRDLRITVPNAALLPALNRHAAMFKSMYNISVKLNVLEVADIAQEVRGEARQQLQGFSDGWIVDPSVTGDLAAVNALANLTSHVFADQELGWSDVAKFFRMVSAYFNKRIVGVPLDGDLFLMYYRRDLFERHNLSVPVTWEEFVEVAEMMNGTDTDGDRVGDLWGVCLDNSPESCKSLWILTAIVAPYLQYTGTKQGVYIDPATLRPLINNPAMTRAAQLYGKLFAFGPKPTGCAAANPFFSNGSCLMTINFGDQFKASAQMNTADSNRRFNSSMLGVSRLPGSFEVLNRTSGAMMACTSATCPYAKLMQLANGSRAVVNFAPFSAFGGWTGMVNARASQDYQMWAFKFFSHISQPNNSIVDVLDPTSGIDPYRTSQLQPSAENLARWAEKGYDVTATSAYLIATGEALDNENTVLDNRLQSVADVTRSVMGNVADNTTWLNQPLSEVLARGQNAMELALNRSGSSGTRDLQIQYWQLLGYSPEEMKGLRPDKGNVSASNISLIESDTEGLHTKTVVELAVLIPVGAVLLAAAVGLLVWRRIIGHRNLLHGSVKAPMTGPQTSLLISDIQDSTLLWEVLPDTVMDTAIQVHHAVVRQALSKHNGYESATEGDSFILAFHSAVDAVACAMRIQTDLLVAPWPPQLLRCMECASASEVWVAPARNALHQHAALLEMLSGGSCELKAQRGRPFCVVRNCWGAAAAATSAVSRRMSCRGSASRLRSLYRPTQPQSLQQQQQQQKYPLTATANGAPQFEAVAPAMAAAAGQLASAGKGADVEAGFRRQDSPEVQLSSPQFGGFSTLSVLGDDDTQGAVSRNWSVSQEGLLSHGLSHYRDETSVGTGLLSTLANILGIGARGRGLQHSQSQHPLVSSISSPLFLSTDKTEQNSNKPWFGGSGGGATAGISAAAVAAAAASTRCAGGTGVLGFDSRRLLKDHIRSVWLVVDVGRSTSPTTDSDAVTGRHGPGNQSASSSKDVTRSPTADNEATMALSSPARILTAAHLPSFTASISGAEGRISSHPSRLPLAPSSPPPGIQVEMAEVSVSSVHWKAQASAVAGESTHLAKAFPYNFGGMSSAPLLMPKAPNDDTIGIGNTLTSGTDSQSRQLYLRPSTLSASPPQRQQLLLPAAPLPSPSRQALQQQTSQQLGCVEDMAVGPTCRQHAVRQFLAFRGLRVRMGIHSGVPDSGHVLYNQAEARYHYTGSGMAIARAVQGAAAGGQVLLSDATFALVRDGHYRKRLRDAVLIHAGEHVLDTKLPAAQQLYQALSRQLLCRLPLQPPLKVTRTIAVGALDAPVGRVAVAFVSVVGAATLQAWNPEVMRQALTVFQEAFWVEASAHAARGAYLVESTGGLLLAAFASTADALATCMAMQSGLLLADWPHELLDHEMCEEVTIATPQLGGTIVREVLFRGLRVKAGIDCGPARAALNGATGRIAYRGRLMNRAARINAQGASGQVLCSRSAWQAASEAAEGGPASRGLAALSLGHVPLKGIGEPVEILEVRPLVTAPPQGPPALMMFGSQPSSSLIGFGTGAAASTTVATGPPSTTSQSPVPVVLPTRGTTNSTRRSMMAMNNRDEALGRTGSGIAAATVSVASVSAFAPVPAAAATAGSVPVLPATAASASNAPANTVHDTLAPTARSTVQGTVPLTASSYDRGTDGTHCDDVTALPTAINVAAACSASGREAIDFAVTSTSDTGAPLLQHSGSCLFGSIPSPLAPPSALSVQQQQQQQIQLHGHGELAAEATARYLRASSRRFSISTQESLMQSHGTLAQMLASPTVQVFRVDATTGIAALEIPSPSLATMMGAPSSTGPTRPMQRPTMDTERSSVEADED